MKKKIWKAGTDSSKRGHKIEKRTATTNAPQIYHHIAIEKKWRENWEKRGAFKADDKDAKRPKFYVLDMFPYPSGSGLHVGHPEGYTATDILSRYYRMKGMNVLHPMGWDAFGLPAENYAIKTKIHPQKSTRDNIKVFTQQIRALGFSYDWEREISTCEPDYYKWTQWFFLFLYKNGLAYKKEAPVNWCESCKTVLANEQVVNGTCDRCHGTIIQKNLTQWFFKITDFIEDNFDAKTKRITHGLLSGLNTIDWPSSTKIAQENWIGKSFGTEVDFKVESSDEKITVYTTRVDTLFSGTFLVIAPEHPLVPTLTIETQKGEVEDYIKKVKGRNELQRTDLSKEKTGVFSGSYAINPATGDKMPIWIADFVLMNYGTGAVFADAHDKRDFEMAKKFGIPLKVSLRPKDDVLWEKVKALEECFEGEGALVNSGQFDGLTSADARVAITEWLEKKGNARKMTNYRLRDWLVSRQRYWGAPIPIIYCDDCGEVAVPEKDLPVELPSDVDFMPTGKSPLIKSKTFHEVSCPKCGKKGENVRREVDTMDTFVCSSWYFLRFMDPHNTKEFASTKLMKKWGPIDLYVGGAEHTVLHLLYSRFFTKALHKFGYIDFDEPFMKLRHQGLILGEDGEKMSKSQGNVINPNEIVEKFGADSLRMYEMFMGPFKDAKPWNTNGVIGIYRFLQKVWKLGEKKFIADDVNDLERAFILNNTLKKVAEDTEDFRFNTAISQMMIFVNELTTKGTTEDEMEILLLILFPYAPHMCSELWEKCEFDGSIDRHAWPKWLLTLPEEVEFAVQVNGKLRGTFKAGKDLSKEDAIATSKANENVSKFLTGEIIKEIFVPGKLVNLVVKGA